MGILEFPRLTTEYNLNLFYEKQKSEFTHIYATSDYVGTEAKKKHLEVDPSRHVCKICFIFI